MSRSEQQKALRAKARRIAHDKAMQICHRMNLPRYLCECAFGEKHDTFHRFGAGGAIMVIGVSIAKFGPHLLPFSGFEFIADCTGYLVHAAGTIPFVDALIRRSRGVIEREIEAEEREKPHA
jgi:hypothetical protein